MAHLRREALVLALVLALLAAIVGGDVAGVAPRENSRAHRHDMQWVGYGGQVPHVRIVGRAQTELGPGVSSPVHLGFLNASPRGVKIRRVRVFVATVTAPRADATHPCTKADFEVRQLRRRVLRLPAQRRVDLADLGVPVADWPRLTMRNRPVNQDGCQGASLTLRYRARSVMPRRTT